MTAETKKKVLTEEKFYIDKTAELEQALKEYPCVYLEGAAASGKTTAIRMICQRQKTTPVLFVSADREKPEEYSEKIARFRRTDSSESRRGWIVVEHFPGSLTEKESIFFLSLIERMEPAERLILESREDLPEALLACLWKGQIQLVTQPALTREEVIRLAAKRNSFLNPSEVYEETGGWAGCVDLLLRLTVHPSVRTGTNVTVRQILQRYEVRTYLETEILQTFHQKEREILREMELCPWLHPDLCREVFQVPDTEAVFESLRRKGVLIRCSRDRLWKRIALFEALAPDPGTSRLNSGFKKENEKVLQQAGIWFDWNGFTKQALYCFEKAGDRERYRKCLRTHYREIPFSGILLSEEFLPEDSSAESCYLRGMAAVNRHDWETLEREIRMTEEQKNQQQKAGTPGKNVRKTAEIWLNLLFCDPRTALEDWMKLVRQTVKFYGPLRLYHILGGSYTFLCGLKDLSGLFVGGRKNERKKAEFWKNSFDAESWKAYQFARMEFYLETKQKDKLPEEDWKLLLHADGDEPWTMQFARYWLLIKLRRYPEAEQLFQEEREEAETAARAFLADEENVVCRRIFEAAETLSSNGSGERILFSWLREKKNEWFDEIREDTVGMWFLRSAACYEIRQYDRTEKILKKMIPFARSGRKSRILAESLFQQAAVNWYRGNRKKALQDVVESFLVTGEFRYVRFYTCCGKNGYDVLENYIEWLSSNSSDTWSRKKKYKYGNVLNMPLEDYMNTLLRDAKKTRGQAAKQPPEETEEALTVTEIIVLKELSTGMTNEEICADLNLKLTTVKGHIYSIYKKLGVKSRVQALLTGKERGLLREE